MTTHTYSLRGDRVPEHTFVHRHLSAGVGHLLDLGPGRNYQMAQYACGLGWNVTSIDLHDATTRIEEPNFTFIQADFLKWEPTRQFDRILNVSTIEHFGVPGRYGIKAYEPDADFRAMGKLLDCIKPTGWQIFTIPVGDRTYVFAPWHKIYGPDRVEKLLAGWEILDQVFSAKSDGVDDYHPVSRDVAFSTGPQPPPHHYYAVGCFKLRNL